MAVATAKELLELKTRSPSMRIYDPGNSKQPARHIFVSAIASEEDAQQILDNMRDQTLANQHYKGIRPWHIVDITAKLDPNQPWLGFEFETGIENRTQYEALINYVWQNVPHCAVDKEGYGTYCPEITFSPENLENYMNGTSAIQRTIKWMNDNGIKLMDFGNAAVGTHLNVSTPSFRERSLDDTVAVTDLIARSLLMLTPEEHVKLFGRVAYGIGQHGEGKWIEFKVFRSTDDLAMLDKYMQTGCRMAELVEAVSRLRVIPVMKGDRYGVASSPYIHNVVDILLGTTPASKLDIRVAKVYMQTNGWRRGVPERNYGLDYSKYRITEVQNAA